MSYDKSKVSPRPWKRTGFGRIEDADGFNINYLKNAVGGFPVNDLINQLHVIHCVNTMETLRDRVVALRDELKGRESTHAYGEMVAYDTILRILDELDGETG